MTRAAIPYKFSVDEYDRMAEAGIFHEDDRVELVAGEIVRMAPVGHRHSGVVNSLNRAFAPLWIARRAVTTIQNPVVLGADSELEPDVMLLRFAENNYRDRKPEPVDVLLLVEVADTSMRYDRLTKVPLYARAGIAEVWLVDLTQNQIEVYRASAAGSFGDRENYRRGQTLAPQAFPDLLIKVEDIIG